MSSITRLETAIEQFEKSNPIPTTLGSSSGFYLTFTATTGWKIEKFNFFALLVRYLFGCYSESHSATTIVNLQNSQIVKDSPLHQKLATLLKKTVLNKINFKLADSAPFQPQLPQLLPLPPLPQPLLPAQQPPVLPLPRPAAEKPKIDTEALEKDKVEASKTAVIPRKGLGNQGNTCWMNGGIQFACRVGNLAETIQKEAAKIRKENGDKNSVIIKFDNVINAISKSQKELDASLVELADCLLEKKYVLPGRQQEDSGNCMLRAIFDNLKHYAPNCEFSAHLKYVTKSKISSQTSVINGNESTVLRSFTCQPSNPRLILSFEEALNYNRKAIFDAPINNEPGIQEIFDVMDSVPNTLVVRFGLNPRGWPKNKTIPLSVDFSSRFSESIRKNLAEQGKALKYKLQTAIIYYGNGSYGHYTAVEVRNGKIYEYNDSSAIEITESQLQVLLQRAVITGWELDDESLAGCEKQVTKRP